MGKIQSYNKMMYNSGPITVSEFISDIPNEIHQQIYNKALSDFLEENPKYNDTNIKIIEIKGKEYWEPSKIRIIDYSTKPYKYSTISLQQWWNNQYNYKEETNIDPMIGSNNDQVDFLNYVQGKATMYDRYENKKYKVDFKNIGKDTEITEDYNVYSRTFEYLRKK